MSEIRKAIIEFMKKNNQTPTWWFKFHTPYTTKQIRSELDSMAREGLVISDRRQSNNTRWEFPK